MSSNLKSFVRSNNKIYGEPCTFCLIYTQDVFRRKILPINLKEIENKKFYAKKWKEKKFPRMNTIQLDQKDKNIPNFYPSSSL